MTETTTPPLTNSQVAEALGLSESGVSRLRSGDRLPSLDVMQKIEDVYGWTVQGQSNARKDDGWTRGFLAVLQTAAEEATEEPSDAPS